MSEPSRNTSNGSNAVHQTSAIHKLLTLAKSLQFAWFIGHFITLICSTFCFLSMNQALYRIAFFGVLESFGIITYQHYSSKPAPNSKSTVTTAGLLQNGDVLYFALALLWFFTPMFTLSLVPYAMFSLFHVLIYFKSILLPEVFGLNAENSKVVSFIANYVRNYNDKCMYWVGSIELGLLALLFFRALLCFSRSWIVLLAFSLFVKIRFENSKYMQSAFAQWRVRLDGIMSHPSIPLVFKRAYGKVKALLIRLSQFRLSRVSSAPVSSSNSNAAQHSQKKE